MNDASQTIKAWIMAGEPLVLILTNALMCAITVAVTLVRRKQYRPRRFLPC